MKHSLYKRIAADWGLMKKRYFMELSMTLIQNHHHFKIIYIQGKAK